MKEWRQTIWKLVGWLVLSLLLNEHGVDGKKNCMQSGMGPKDLYKNGKMNPNYMWYQVGSKVQVPVVLDPGYTHKERDVILGGLHEIQDNTCIDFYIFGNNSRALKGYDYVYITKAKTGCWSHIGRIGRGRQELSLGRGCVNHRTAVHEMIHALGFAHEHVRFDRDNYVYIFWGNIMPGRESNFAKRTTKSTDPYGPYDYDSVMHYDKRAFSFNGMDTIKPLKRGVRIGVRQTMSPWDIKKLVRMYNCDGGGYDGGYSNSNEAHFNEDDHLKAPHSQSRHEDESEELSRSPSFENNPYFSERNIHGETNSNPHFERDEGGGRSLTFNQLNYPPSTTSYFNFNNYFS